MYSKLLLLFSAAGASSAANLGNYVYARQDGDSVTVSTISPESVSTSVIGGSTTDVIIPATTSSWTLGTEASDTSSVTVAESSEEWTIGTETINTTLGTETITVTVDRVFHQILPYRKLVLSSP